MGYWKIDADNEKQLLNIELVGEIPYEQALKFLPDFFKAQEKIEPKECKIVFDLGRYKLYPSQVEEILKIFFEIYRDKEYKVVVMKIFRPQKELARKMRLLSEKVGLTTLEFFIID